MKKESIYRMIDNSIKKSLQDEKSLVDIINDVEKKMKNVFRIIEKDNIDISSLFDVLINNESIGDDTNLSKRVKYVYYYITHCKKRIVDINWIISKQYSDLFISSRNYTYESMFSMIILKEKLSKENSILINNLPF